MGVWGRGGGCGAAVVNWGERFGAVCCGDAEMRVEDKRGGRGSWKLRGLSGQGKGVLVMWGVEDGWICFVDSHVLD